MGRDSKIEWTTHTFNPWRGCTKVSPGCTNCYAESLSKRFNGTLGIWGDKGTRVVAAESYWQQPRKWDRAAKESGERHRVFCASLADVFEDRPELIAPRVRLFHLITETPSLDWLLLTKRPENVRRFYGGDGVSRSWSESMPPNAWIGTSVENQATADERIPHLLAIPATVRFLSMEPLLGPVDLGCAYAVPPYCTWCSGHEPLCKGRLDGIDWVIVGGESGPGARPMHPWWAKSIQERCHVAGVPFFFKQWGEWMPFDGPSDLPRGRDNTPVGLIKVDGRFISPYSHEDAPGWQMARVGKKAAGRTLWCRTWDEFPLPKNAEVTR